MKQTKKTFNYIRVGDNVLGKDVKFPQIHWYVREDLVVKEKTNVAS